MSLDQDFEENDSDPETARSWGESAPKGAKAVMNRILREGNRVPLFLGQTFVNSLRDVGYNSTTSAICEHVDNSIQAGAKEIRVYFNQSGRGSDGQIDVLILDDGAGMPSNVLQVATSFGGSMSYENRSGIGRFGVGMKTAALSLAPAFEIYSWQEQDAFYSMSLDVNEIGANRANLIELPEPQFSDALPSQIARILSSKMSYPREADKQDILISSEERVGEVLGKSGTLIFIPDCDRLTYKTAKTLVEHATKEMARVYRRQIGDGLRLYINNRKVEAFDPTFWMKNARHSLLAELHQTQSTLVNSWPDIEIPVSEGGSRTARAIVRLFMLPIEDWYDLPRKVLKNDLQLFEDHLVSFMRNDREVHIGAVSELSGKRHADAFWMRIQVDFSGELDEAFGVAMNKQGVRPKKYALDVIRDLIKDDVARVRDRTAKYRAEHSSRGSKAHLSEAERRANDADAFQARPLSAPTPQTEAEAQALDDGLRVLAITVKRDDENDAEAFERVKNSRYITTFRHDPYWPFYHVDFQLGKVILTINTAHPFFTKLYEPLSRLSQSPEVEDEQLGENGSGLTAKGASTEGSELLIALQMVLLSLARVQSQMSTSGDSERLQLFETLRTEWSSTLKTQLAG